MAAASVWTRVRAAWSTAALFMVLLFMCRTVNGGVGRPNHKRDSPFASMRGAISVDHFDGDPPALGDLMAALACPFTDGGAVGATDRRAGRPNTAASAGASRSPASGHPGLKRAAQFLGVLLRQVDLVADTVQRELHRFVGGLAVEIIEQGDGDLLDHLHHRPSYGSNPNVLRQIGTVSQDAGPPTARDGVTSRRILCARVPPKPANYHTSPPGSPASSTKKRGHEGAGKSSR